MNLRISVFGPAGEPPLSAESCMRRVAMVAGAGAALAAQVVFCLSIQPYKPLTDIHDPTSYAKAILASGLLAVGAWLIVPRLRSTGASQLDRAVAWAARICATGPSVAALTRYAADFIISSVVAPAYDDL